MQALMREMSSRSKTLKALKFDFFFFFNIYKKIFLGLHSCVPAVIALDKLQIVQGQE